MEEALPKTEKKSVKKWLKDHPKTVFWSRFALWTTFSLILPSAFIIWRFDLFKTISKIQLGGWSIFLIFLAAVFIFTVIKYVRLAFKGRYSFIGQCLAGFCKIILPLLVALLIIENVKNTIELLIQVLGCTLICEAVAVPLNPLPKWAYDMQKGVRESERMETVDYLLNGFFRRKKEEENNG